MTTCCNRGVNRDYTPGLNSDLLPLSELEGGFQPNRGRQRSPTNPQPQTSALGRGRDNGGSHAGITRWPSERQETWAVHPLTSPGVRQLGCFCHCLGT